MKKRNLLLTLVLTLTFIGGFLQEYGFHQKTNLRVSENVKKNSKKNQTSNTKPKKTKQ